MNCSPFIHPRFLLGFFASVAISSIAISLPALAQGVSLKSLQPSRGPERSLVIVEGEGLADAVVIWDAGLPTERKLAPSVQGATVFSVPAKSALGEHPVILEGAAGRSTSLKFTVEGVTPVAVPRIDGVMLAGANFDEAGKVRVTLYVQGANIDVDAKVLIDGIETNSGTHKTITGNLFGADPQTLGYPIRHYLSRIVSEISRPLGSDITVGIINENGEKSEKIAYSLPKNSKTFSSAGDGIADDEKINGYDNGTGKIDLKALGADPYRKVVFLQMDIMEGIPRPIESSIAVDGTAVDGTLETVRKMFANAPIINPYGRNGIDLVIDTSGVVPKWPYIDFLDEDDVDRGVGSFWKMKAEHFNPRRVGLYHYAVWGLQRLDRSSGYSNVDFDGHNVGDSFMVTLANAPIQYRSVQSQAETIAHELGHNLGQKHGGSNHSRRKPNYWSIMSYAWQLRTSKDDDFRRHYPTCTQIYYAMPGAVEKDGKLPAQRRTRLDYSEGMGPILGNNKPMEEKNGVCGQSIDWNQNGRIDAAPVTVRVDADDLEDAQIWDIPNWPRLRFDGPKLGGTRYP